MNEFPPQLLAIGLNEKEASVYWALLRVGQTGTTKLINETTLHGQYVYNALIKLEELGVVKKESKNGRFKYSALSLDSAVRSLREKEKIAIELSNEIKSKYLVQEKQHLDIRQGMEEFIDITFEYTENLLDGDEILVLGGMGDKFFSNLGKRSQEYLNLLEKKNIKVKYIGNESQKTYLTNLKLKSPGFDARILAGIDTGLVNINLYKNQTVFNIYGEPTLVISLINQVVFESQKSFFYNLWNLSKPV